MDSVLVRWCADLQYVVLHFPFLTIYNIQVIDEQHHNLSVWSIREIIVNQLEEGDK